MGTALVGQWVVPLQSNAAERSQFVFEVAN